MELAIVRDGEQMLLGQVTDVQDINDYGRRDRGRPKRDARVGMLPPKLAQTIINLAVGAASIVDSEDSAFPAERAKTDNSLAASASEEATIEARAGKKITILDPFCGTGVIPQEALLRGYDVIGTDLEPRMIDYTQQNLAWLRDKYPVTAEQTLEVGDATSHKWPAPIHFVACEGFLGTPFSAVPSPEKLRETIHDSNTIMKKFLKNIAPQLAPGARLCIGAPAWFTNSGVHHLPTLDDLENLGYNRIDFEHARREDLIYHRDDQIVGRELVVLVKE
jgi:SAM-dependent methyltransferase